MAFRRGCEESKTKALTQYVMSIMQQFRHFDMTKTFEHCGYTVQGRFDPTKRLSDEVSSEGHSCSVSSVFGIDRRIASKFASSIGLIVIAMASSIFFFVFMTSIPEPIRRIIS
ncbi:hypothetical protein Ae201684P_007492 [Aphanomyces euteiches]|uniref:Uncharacterized protein n=1 Tax=Aphanomyces euteiches TaxID=100861 RepID=A0A6G0W7W7_9STRA|nr:hypothetical protein Ae201684_018564 [Aphanomyces euteiches]KAH9079816.1 hypothetical protein Ae201684P_007492 [Aphanomyces euteiches]